MTTEYQAVNLFVKARGTAEAQQYCINNIPSAAVIKPVAYLDESLQLMEVTITPAAMSEIVSWFGLPQIPKQGIGYPFGSLLWYQEK